MEEFATSTTINEIRTFKQRKGQGQQARSKGKICGKCGMSHPPRECPVWGKKCHKCGNKNHFSTQCRSKQSGGGNRKSHSTSRGCKGKGKPCQSRSRSNPATKSAYSMESASFQDHSDDLHGEKNRWPSMEKVQTSMDSIKETSMEPLSRHSNSTEFLKQSFSTISRSKSVASISNDTDPEGKTKILTILQLKLPHHNGIDDITVKVDNGAEGNILPLKFFQGHVSSCTRCKWLPKTRIPERIQDDAWMLWWWESGKSWQYQTQTPALLREVISRPFTLHCRDQDTKALSSLDTQPASG